MFNVGRSRRFHAFPSRNEMIACLHPFMKKLLAFLALAGLALLFASCTTGPSYKAVIDSFPPLAADAGRIFIYRDAIYGPRQTPAVLLNGSQIGLSTAQGFFYVDRPAGDYKVELAGEGGPPASFTLNSGQTLYVRISLHANLTESHQYPEVVDDTVAQREIVHCKYITRMSAVTNQSIESMDNSPKPNGESIDNNPKPNSVTTAPGYSLSLDLHEFSDHFEVHATLPDAKTSDIHVKLNDDQTLRVEVGNQTAGEWENYTQTIQLPSAVQADKMKIDHTENELVIVLPKA
jgi:HSP20 family molecular chaperone IbpA